MNRRQAHTGGNDTGSKALQILLAQHLQAFEDSLGQMRRNLAGNLFSIAVIGISLALPAGFYLVLDNAQRVMENWDGSVQIALYLKPEIPDTRAAELQQQLSTHISVEQVALITREQALEEYKRSSGFGDALDSLEENPLPSMLLIEPRADIITGGQGAALLEELSRLPETETAQYDRQWVKRLIVILQILKRSVIILATLLSIAVLLIIGNTIRLSIINKRPEIAINKLFGATNSYIRRPFLYSGLIYGLAGSLLAWLLLLILTLLMADPVDQLASLYNSDFRLNGLSVGELTVLILSGSCLGLIGSWIAVARHIRESEPG